MIVRVQLVREEDGAVVTSDLFNSRAGKLLWEAPVTAPIIDKGMKIYGYEVIIHQRPLDGVPR